MNLFAFIGNDELRKLEAMESELAKWQGADSGSAGRGSADQGSGGDCLREVYFGEDMRWEQVAESFQTADLFAPRKAIVIRNWDKLPAAQQKHLEKVLARGNTGTAVFLVGDKWDASSKLRKAAAAAGGVQEFKLPYENKIPQWLCQRAQQKYRRRLGLPEARLLQEIVGGDLAELDHELEKLDTFLPESAPVTAADIQELVSPLKVFGIFEFQRTMGMRRKAELLPALRNLMDNDFREAFLIAQRLFGHFLTLLKIRSLLDEGASEPAIMETLKLNSYIMQKEGYLDQARTRSAERWKQLLVRLAKLELELKQGRYPHRFEVELAFAAMV